MKRGIDKIMSINKQDINKQDINKQSKYIQAKSIIGSGSSQVDVKQLNKPLIYLIAAIVLILFIFITMDSFQDSKNSNKNKTHSLHAITNQVPNLQEKDIYKNVSSLPSSYKQADKIHKILDRSSIGVNQDAEVSAKLQQELSLMRNSQKSLQDQVFKLQGELKAKPDNTIDTAEEKKAKESSLFPAGGFPAYIRDDKQVVAKVDASKHQPEPYSSYATQNMQSQKQKFFSKQGTVDVYNKDRIQYPVSPYILQAGTVLPVVLQTTLNSDNPGVVLARVRSDVYDSINGQHLLLPKGTKLLGSYNSSISPGQSRIQVRFQRLIRPDGSSITLPSSVGVNNTGMSGAKGSVDNHWGSIIGAAALTAVFDIPSVIAQNQMLKNMVGII